MASRRSFIDKILLSFAAGFLVAIGLVSYLGHFPLPLAASYGLASILTFAVYGVDKSRAQREQWRISEVALHSLEIMGGWPGALIAQRLFRHKNRKVSFQIVFWFIVVAHLAFWGWMIARRYGGRLE